MIYFSSDLHLWLNHNKDFIWRERGFSSVEEMNETIVSNFNSVLTDDDHLYLLGDCCMGLNNISIPYLKQIKGHKHLIVGNHDTVAKIAEYLRYDVFESIEFGDRIKYHKFYFILSHYPMLVHNTTKDNVWNLHGHTHQKTIFSEFPSQYHVGVDSQDCFPVSIEDIYNDIKELENND